MTEVIIGASGLSILIWIYLLAARGGFWRADQRVNRAGKLEKWPDLVAVIPARNEVETIGATVASLLDQDYPGNLKIIVVDDNSTDGTGDAVGRSDNVHVLTGTSLEVGWTGKLWAVHQGLVLAEKISPNAEYTLLTDADITHHRSNLSELVFKAASESLHLVSLMVKLRCATFWEYFLIPAFVFFFQKLYPFSWVNSQTNNTAAAAGGCMLIRLDTLRHAGGVKRIKDHLIDDCAMGTLIKSEGPIWLGLSDKTTSSRAYVTLFEIWHMVARTAFVQLDHSILKLLGTIVAMIVIYLAPPLGFFVGVLTHNAEMSAMGALGWGLMSFAYHPILKLYGRSRIEAFCLPAAGFLYALMTVSSAVRHWRGAGGNWKGRTYSK